MAFGLSRSASRLPRMGRLNLVRPYVVWSGLTPSSHWDMHVVEDDPWNGSSPWLPLIVGARRYLGLGRCNGPVPAFPNVVGPVTDPQGLNTSILESCVVDQTIGPSDYRIIKTSFSRRIESGPLHPGYPHHSERATDRKRGSYAKRLVQSGY